jgi:citrate/tricarballylate utilization protein
VPVARRLVGGEYAMLSLLFLVSASGLLLLALRHTGAMGVLLALHLGLVLALFVALPYSKMVHGVYRGLALWRHAREKRGSAMVAAE